MPLIAEGTDYVRGGTQKDEYGAGDVVSVTCPLCGGEGGDQLCTEHGVIGIRRCGGCGLIYVSPRLRAPEAVYWGDAEVYFEEARLVFEGKRPHHRDPNYRAELDAIQRFKPGGRFLDVGCNMGMLGRLAMQRGFAVVGVEPSPSLSALARRHGFPVHNCFLSDVSGQEDGSFDVVALSDVFEHVTDPLALLADARRLLRPDGVLYVKVPNGRWNLLKQRLHDLAGRRPRVGIWDSYEHVVHYTDRTLSRMLAKGGFEVQRLAVEAPIQSPNWHEYVGHYYQYPTPWHMDATRKLMRSAFYWLSGPERLLRGGGIGFLAPNVVALARVRPRE